MLSLIRSHATPYSYSFHPSFVLLSSLIRTPSISLIRTPPIPHSYSCYPSFVLMLSLIRIPSISHSFFCHLSFSLMLSLIRIPSIPQSYSFYPSFVLRRAWCILQLTWCLCVALTPPCHSGLTYTPYLHPCPPPLPPHSRHPPPVLRGVHCGAKKISANATRKCATT